MGFQVGEKVVYPNQGVGIIEQISTRNLTGQPQMFYLLKLNASSLRVMVLAVPLGRSCMRNSEKHVSDCNRVRHVPSA